MDYTVFQEPNSLGHPMEDAWLVGGGCRIFAVADGVTRDHYVPEALRSTSGAADAAATFCHHAVSFLTSVPGNASAQDLRSALDAANIAVGKLNQMHLRQQPPDFLENDFLGTVGIVALFDVDKREPHVQYAYVGDCRIAIMNAAGEIRLLNPDPLEGMYAHLAALEFESVTRRREYVRSALRNARRAVDCHGASVGYGVFTGEKDVSRYYGFGEISLEKGDAILLFSDGITPFLSASQFKSAVLNYLGQESSANIQTSLGRIGDQFTLTSSREFQDDKTLLVIHPRRHGDNRIGDR